LEGYNSFIPSDGFIGYSTSEEVKATKIEVLDKISSEDFMAYLEKGKNENNPYTRPDSLVILLEFFNNIKAGYEDAVQENKALIFQIG
jgi:hypothetical protein